MKVLIAVYSSSSLSPNKVAHHQQAPEAAPSWATVPHMPLCKMVRVSRGSALRPNSPE